MFTLYDYIEVNRTSMQTLAEGAMILSFVSPVADELLALKDSVQTNVTTSSEKSSPLDWISRSAISRSDSFLFVKMPHDRRVLSQSDPRLLIPYHCS